MTFARIEEDAGKQGLMIVTAFHPSSPAEDGLPTETETVVLLGPRTPRFDPVFFASDEQADGHPNALDRWSRRVIGDIATAHGALPLFPFGGPPYLPFLRWMEKGGHAWSSPVGMMIHHTLGLWVSCRGALAVPSRLTVPPPVARPCETCVGQPCRTACPVDALGGGKYDVPRCKTFLETPAGQDCVTLGCRARHACPVGRDATPTPRRAAFHMRAFRGPT